VTLENYEIAILLKMYDEKIIGKPGYTSIQKARSKIHWEKISSAYKVKKSFDTIARRLVKRKLLSDDGKSMGVLYLDKLGLDFVVGYMKQNPGALKTLETKLSEDL
jgi:hypothetical protein